VEAVNETSELCYGEDAVIATLTMCSCRHSGGRLSRPIHLFVQNPKYKYGHLAPGILSFRFRVEVLSYHDCSPAPTE